jgi:hypothetical protein
MSAVEAPTFRHPRTGNGPPAVILPAELNAAIASDVLAEAGYGYFRNVKQVHFR